MHRLKRHLSYANVVATLALVIAVAGGSTAIALSASTAKKTDVNKKGNIRAGRVTTSKLANGAVTARKVADIDVVQVTQSDFGRVSCPAGDRLLSGGAHVNSGGTPALSQSNPDGNGWSASTNAGGGAVSLTVYAVCLRD
jgi:hypothetical protein